ncbi:unnamed protein product [Calicophoron daubneyi]|uniref:cyclin-dependent kinase n=1 Tax=Calicophoron daubneyi TaxID=300641 RepID=A0AAV2T6K0_CALDB
MSSGVFYLNRDHCERSRTVEGHIDHCDGNSLNDFLLNCDRPNGGRPKEFITNGWKEKSEPAHKEVRDHTGAPTVWDVNNTRNGHPLLHSSRNELRLVDKRNSARHHDRKDNHISHPIYLDERRRLESISVIPVEQQNLHKNDHKQIQSEHCEEQDAPTVYKFVSPPRTDEFINRLISDCDQTISNPRTESTYHSPHSCSHTASLEDHNLASATSSLSSWSGKTVSILEPDPEFRGKHEMSSRTQGRNQQASQSLKDRSSGGQNHRPLSRKQLRHSLSEMGFGKIESYRKFERIGEGTYATVYKGYSMVLKKMVALKEIRMEKTEGAPCTAIREISLLRYLRHANIVTLHDVIFTRGSLTLVFEYAGHDLRTFMERNGGTISMKLVQSFMFQMLRALEFCHARQVLHRDLKPQNLLINRNNELKLADFGLARAQSIPTKTYSNEVATLWYRPPDVLLGERNYSGDIDMWGAGCIFYEMATGSTLFPGESKEGQILIIFKKMGIPSESYWPELRQNAMFMETVIPNISKEKIRDLDRPSSVLDSPDDSKLSLGFKDYKEYLRVLFTRRVSRLDKVGIDLLVRCLALVGFRRITANSALHHAYFHGLLPNGMTADNLSPEQSIIFPNRSMTEVKKAAATKKPQKARSKLFWETGLTKSMDNLHLLSESPTNKTKVSVWDDSPKFSSRKQKSLGNLRELDLFSETDTDRSDWNAYSSTEHLRYDKHITAGKDYQSPICGKQSPVHTGPSGCLKRAEVVSNNTVSSSNLRTLSHNRWKKERATPLTFYIQDGRATEMGEPEPKSGTNELRPVYAIPSPVSIRSRTEMRLGFKQTRVACIKSDASKNHQIFTVCLNSYHPAGDHIQYPQNVAIEPTHGNSPTWSEKTSPLRSSEHHADAPIKRPFIVNHNRTTQEIGLRDGPEYTLSWNHSVEENELSNPRNGLLVNEKPNGRRNLKPYPRVLTVRGPNAILREPC